LNGPMLSILWPYVVGVKESETIKQMILTYTHCQLLLLASMLFYDIVVCAVLYLPVVFDTIDFRSFAVLKNRKRTE
jgi:hypothetical protein